MKFMGDFLEMPLRVLELFPNWKSCVISPTLADDLQNKVEEFYKDGDFITVENIDRDVFIELDNQKWLCYGVRKKHLLICDINGDNKQKYIFQKGQQFKVCMKYRGKLYTKDELTDIINRLRTAPPLSRILATSKDIFEKLIPHVNMLYEYGGILIELEGLYVLGVYGNSNETLDVIYTKIVKKEDVYEKKLCKLRKRGRSSYYD